MLKPNPRTLTITAWQTGFARKLRWGMQGCPKAIHWPDVEDYAGCKACIDAILSRDQKALDAIEDAFPDQKIGFESFLMKLRRGESTGCYARLLCAKPLPTGKTLYIELIVKSRYKYIIGTIRDLKKHIIAQKIMAKKRNPRAPVPAIDLSNPLAPVSQTA